MKKITILIILITLVNSTFATVCGINDDCVKKWKHHTIKTRFFQKTVFFVMDATTYDGRKLNTAGACIDNSYFFFDFM